MSRPKYINELLARPLAPLKPHAMTESSNPPYSTSIQSQIADGHYHPLLESVLHLMNDDLFSAHFLLRKMQEDEWGKWLHACLHLSEGDLEKNAKLWYEQIEPEVLSTYWGKEEPVKKAHQAMKRVGQGMRGELSEEELKEVRETRWKELVAAMEALEKKHGWGEVDGTTAYTKDEKPEHKSNVLGEGWRTRTFVE